MSSAHVTVSPESQVIIFASNLLKAPPLNRRGRKKWHERYFLLRANKTIEIHKSRKAAEAQKAPRRVIDLRECISLELGLEYKNLQHILSLGTFKRTFFLAAPSNALMLQWGNVLEKVKSAVSGEAIEVLDIGLRNARNCNAVHRVKPSEAIQPFQSFQPPPKRIWGKLYKKGASKSSIVISSMGQDPQNSLYVNRGSGNVGYSSYYASPNNRSSSLSNQEMYGREPSAGYSGRLTPMYGYPRMADTSIETVDLRERGRFSGGSSSNTSSSGPSPSHPPFSGGAKIPPPNIMNRGWRANEGLHRHGYAEAEYQGEEDARREERWGRFNGSGRDGVLHRSEAFRSVGSKMVAATEGDGGVGGGGGWRVGVSEDNTSRRRIQNDVDGGGHMLTSTPLKQSRHYRKIELQAEKPLLGVREEEEEEEGGSSDEDRDSVVSEARGKSRSGGVVSIPSNTSRPYHVSGRDAYHQPLQSVPERHEAHGRRRNYSGPPVSGRRSGGYHASSSSSGSRECLELGGRGYMGGSGGGGGWTGIRENGHGYYDDVGRNSPHRPQFLSRPPPQAKEVAAQRFYSLESLQKNLREERATNNYCKVTVGERDEGALSGLTSSRAGISNAKLDKIRSKSSVDSVDYENLQLPSPHPSSFCEEEEEEEEVTMRRQNLERKLSDTAIQLSPPLSPPYDGRYQLPARGSESYIYRSSGSIKSPIDEVLAPPLHFEEMQHNPSQGCVVNQTISEEVEPQTRDGESKAVTRKQSTVATDRHSTESYDTGYTSSQGQSPGYSEKTNLTTVEECTSVAGTTSTPPENFPSPNLEEERKNSQSNYEDSVSELSVGSVVQRSQSGYSIRHSQTSYASTDSIRCYVPFVFQRSGRTQDREPSKLSLFVVVCLVENSDTLIKELMSQKTAGGYHVVECESEVGKSVVSSGDDFTVETALEDLEFGFSVTTSKQKDVYINRAKVREFQFQINNLFGCSGKPFSCDVEIRHADQLTVLPIEIETTE